MADSCRQLFEFLLAKTGNGENGYVRSLLLGYDYAMRFALRMLFPSVGGDRCGAGRSSFAVDCGGTVWPCQSFTGLAGQRLGSTTGLAWERHRSWVQPGVAGGECQTCWARYLCGGGCQAHATIAAAIGGNPSAADCALTRALVHLSQEFLAMLSVGDSQCLQRIATDIADDLPPKHRQFVPAGLRAVEIPKIVAADIQPSPATQGDTVRVILAVVGAHPGATVSIADSRSGYRACEPMAAFPATRHARALREQYGDSLRFFRCSELIDVPVQLGDVRLWIEVRQPTGEVATSALALQIQ